MISKSLISYPIHSYLAFSHFHILTGLTRNPESLQVKVKYCFIDRYECIRNKNIVILQLDLYYFPFRPYMKNFQCILCGNNKLLQWLEKGSWYIKPSVYLKKNQNIWLIKMLQRRFFPLLCIIKKKKEKKPLLILFYSQLTFSF